MVLIRATAQQRSIRQPWPTTAVKRIVQDIAEFCTQILTTAGENQDRSQALFYLHSQFEPAGVVEIALATLRAICIPGDPKRRIAGWGYGASPARTRRVRLTDDRLVRAGHAAATYRHSKQAAQAVQHTFPSVKIDPWSTLRCQSVALLLYSCHFWRILFELER